MQAVRVYRLDRLPKRVVEQLRAAQTEAARAWNLCVGLLRRAMDDHGPWPNRRDYQAATRGKFALNAQSIQAVYRGLLGTLDTTRQLRKAHPEMRMRYPHKEKRFRPIEWPGQAVSYEGDRVVLPMGRGRPSIVLKIDAPQGAGAARIVWHDGYELHIVVDVPAADSPPGERRATIDLGEIHQAVVATDTGKALVVSGRGIRTLKRQRNKALGEIARKRSRCKKGSRRWRKLQAARSKMTVRIERRIRDLRHQGTRKVIDFCVTNEVGKLFIGNPDGIRKRPSGRHHSQRMSQWEYGKDIKYLGEKAKRAHITCFTGSERGTSSRCPECGHHQKPRSRNWACRACGFTGHRDVVGATNMHELAFGVRIEFPSQITYRRAGKVRRSSPDTGRSCPGLTVAQAPRREDRASDGPHHGLSLEAHPL